MKPKKSTDQVLIRGQLLINIPVAILIAGVPTLIWWLSNQFLSPRYTLFVVLIGLVLGFVAAWTWWSFAIVAWRRWAFGNIPEKDWPLLKKKAIEGNLIWPDGSRFEKTEFRNPEDERIIRKINEKIRQQLQARQAEMVVTEDDPSIPEEIAYYYDRRAIIAGWLYMLLIIGVGAYFLFRGDYVIGTLVIGSSYFSLDRSSFRKFRDRDIQLKMTNIGLSVKMGELYFTEWKHIEHIVVDMASKRLSLDRWEEEDCYALTVPLSDLGIEDYEEFLRTLNVFLFRYERLAKN